MQRLSVEDLQTYFKLQMGKKVKKDEKTAPDDVVSRMKKI